MTLGTDRAPRRPGVPRRLPALLRQPVGRARRSRWPVRFGRAAFLLAVAGLLARQVAGDAGGVAAALRRIGAGHAVLSLLAAVLGLGASGLAWRSLLAALGAAVPVSAVPPVFFVAQLGKYLPGAVWPYLAQVRLGRRYGVTGSQSAAGSVVFVLAHCATGGAVAAAVLPWVSPAATRRFWWALVFAPLLLLLLHPRVLLPVLRLAHRLTRRGAAPARLAGRRVAAALGWLMLTWVGYGAGLLALLAPLTDRALLPAGGLSLGGYALAWTVGFAAAAVLVVAAPAGLGVREVVLVALLTPVTSAAAATAVALVSRLVQTAGDLLWALAGAAVSRRAAAPGAAAPGAAAPRATAHPAAAHPAGPPGAEPRAEPRAGPAG
ncbi:MAG: glycosyltransferase 2 family protein [Mycobacteriales bacterium]